MGASVSTNKKIAAFVRADGQTIYFAFEETYSKNDYPHTPDWSARAVGTYDDVLTRLFECASSCEGGMLQTRRGHTDPETYLQKWRAEFKAPVPMPDEDIVLTLGGTSMYSTICDNDVAEAVEVLTKIGRTDLVDALRKGPITLRLHADIDIIIALYGIRTKIALWKIMRYGPPCGQGTSALAPAKRKTTYMPPSTKAYHVDENNVLVSIDGAPYQHMGWHYCAAQQYLMSTVLPLEILCDGAAASLLKPFREMLRAAPVLPDDTVITVIPGAGEHIYHRDNAKKLALALGAATTMDNVPDQFEVSFGQVKAAEEEYLLSTLEASQLRWKLVPDGVAPTLPLGPMLAQAHAAQESLF
jgi:hypothetical protein